MISSILVNSKGVVLKEDNADIVQNPASLTKLMTLWLTFDALALDRVVTVPDHAEIRKQPGKIGQSNMGLKAGMKVSVLDLVLGMIVPSGNDAATTVAHVLGPDGAFLEKMNAEALRMGLTNTRFISPSGLGRGESTARDMAILARRLHDDYPHYRSMFGIGSFAFAGRRYKTTNTLALSNRHITGLKTGTLSNLHRCLAASASRRGVTVFSVVMNCPDRACRDTLTSKLLELGLAGKTA